jgi:Tfp pilus assembly protein PilE
MSVLHRENSRRAFSYIEMIVMTAIIGVVVGGMAVPAYRSSLERARGHSCHSNLAAIEAAKDKFFFENPDREDVTVTELQRYFPNGKIPTCPSNPQTSYLFQSRADGEDVLRRDVFVRCGEDGKTGSGTFPFQSGEKTFSSAEPILYEAPDGLHDLGHDPQDPVYTLNVQEIAN